MRGPWGFSDVYKVLSTFHLSIFPLQYTPLTLVFIPAMDAVDNGCEWNRGPSDSASFPSIHSDTKEHITTIHG